MRFPKENIRCGGTSGSNTHTHSVMIETGAHSCTDTTDAQSNIPPYMDVIYAKRDDPAGSIEVGDEEANEAGSVEAASTYSYLYNGDGARVMEVVSTTNVITTVFIGNYYEFTISNTQTITRSYYYAGSTERGSGGKLISGES